MEKSRAIRPEVLVAGDPVRAPHIAGMVMHSGLRVASYVPEYSGDTPNFGIAALASSARVIVETLDYPLDAKRELLDEIAQVLRPNTLVIASALAMTGAEVMLALNGHQHLAVFGMLEPSHGVELARPDGSRPEALQAAADFWSSIGVESITVSDTPGLVTPRILACIVNEAAWALGEGVASVESIDAAMQLGANHPDGPLHRADQIGLHRIMAVLQNLQDFYGDPAYRTAPALRRLLLRGRMGVEYGGGFYDYAQAAGGPDGQDGQN